MKLKNSRGTLKPILLIACLAILSASAGPKQGNGNGPTNSWDDWRYKKFICGFTNSLLVSLNGHTIPVFATNLFDNEMHVYLYSAADGEVFGAGDISLVMEGRDAVFNVEAEGSLTTKGSKPNLSFKLTGEGSGTVGGVEGTADLEVQFVQTDFIVLTPGGSAPEVYYAEGTISGKVKQHKGDTLKFEETIRVLLDNVPGHFGDMESSPQLRLDLVKIDEKKFAGHAHGTNNCFGRYEGEPDDLLAKGTYKSKSGDLSMDVRGLGPSSVITGSLTAKLDSAPPDSSIHVSDVIFKVKAYGQKPTWSGNGVVYPTEP